MSDCTLVLRYTLEQTKLSILNKHRVLCDPPGDDPSAYQAQTGDLVVADVQAFLLNEDGSRGAAVEVASGDSIEVPEAVVLSVMTH